MSEMILILGGGIFGLTTAWELLNRGYNVSVIDQAPIPNPAASSTDISKVIRMDYGADAFYMDLMEECLRIWRNWNDDFGEEVFHETGVLLLARKVKQHGGFEFESLKMLKKRHHPYEEMTSNELATSFPMWNSSQYASGYFNPQGGWSPSGRVVELIAERVRDLGGSIVHQPSPSLQIEKSGQGHVIAYETGETYIGDKLVLCTGTWTPKLLPKLKRAMRSIAQPVFHFEVGEIDMFSPPLFPVWTADVAHTGWYGFPAKSDGTLKVANHGPGLELNPNAQNEMPGDIEKNFRDFFAVSLPALAKAPALSNRLCFYCDTYDGDFWIGEDPEEAGLIVSAGGSGHAFKFAPMLGKITADVVEGKSNRYTRRFAWREIGKQRSEAARFADSPS